MTIKENIFILVISVLIIHSIVSSAQGRTENKPIAQGKEMYMHYCASCHGNKGDGKGFNAKNLDPRPAVHTDAVFMNKRTDKELHDAINGGGRTIGKSTLMPPWGNTFSEAQVQSLVFYLRKLCNCKGL